MNVLRPSLLTGLLAFSSLGCSRNNTESPNPPMASASVSTPATSLISQMMRSRIDQEGTAGQGTLTFLRQIHPNRYVGTTGLSVADMRNVALYQLEILKELERRRPTEVLVEGYTTDLSPESLRAPGARDPIHNDIRLERLRRAFPTGVPVQPSDDQIRLLYSAGGALIYGALHTDVRLYRTLTPAEDQAILRDEADLIRSAMPHIQDEIQRRMQAGTLPIPQGVAEGGQMNVRIDPRQFFNDSQRSTYREITHTRRNFYAVREARRVVEGNPNRSVAIVFGAVHNFCGAFNQLSWHPSTTSVWWTGGEWVPESELPPPCQ